MYYEKKNKKYYMSIQKYQKTYSMKISHVYTYIFLLYMMAGAVTFIFEKIWVSDSLIIKHNWLFLVLLVLAVLLHEIIHAVFAAIFSPNGFKNIKIGLSLKSVIAYCSINENMKVINFKLVAIAPFIILGIIPLIVSFIYGWKVIFNISIILSLGSIGDLILFYWLCKEKNNYWVKDTGGTKKLEIIVFEQ